MLKGVAIFFGLFVVLVALLFWAKMKPVQQTQPVPCACAATLTA